MNEIILERSIISSRDYVEKLFSSISNNTIIDFKNVDFISRSSAHEFIQRVRKAKDKKIEVHFKNVNEDIKNMLRMSNTASVFV